MKWTRQFLFAVLLFVCPLIFFTNLTRNPYVTQISLLNLALLLSAALWAAQGFLGERMAVPRTPLDVPLAAWLGVCILSWVVAYFGHAAFFRPAMINEGARNFLFVLINTIIPFYLAAASAREGDAAAVPLGLWIAFVSLWGLLWTLFPQMREQAAPVADIWRHLWDGYGAFVWAAGLAGVLWLTRKGRWIDYLHLVFATAFLASVYGILQYFNFEFIWPNVLNPYGGRSVSTFGNPNFMSSYDVVVLPLAVHFFVQARGARRLAYAILVLSIEAALLCSLTRSSWLGAAAAAAALLLSAPFRREVAEEARPCGLLFGAALVMALMWPSSLISSGYTPSVLGRLSEIAILAKHEGAYSPFHQRVLIWTCAWMMGHENPLTGKGWGLFELYYPFYQGFLLNNFDFYSNLRTHANNAHNEIMEIWAQTGILGVGVLFWIWTTFFASMRGMLRGARGQDGVFLAAAAGVAGMLIDNMLNVSMHFAVPGFTFWWIAGLAMGAAARSKPQRIAPKTVAVALTVLSLGLCPYWIRTWEREAWYFAGFKLLRQAQAQPALMPTAVKALEVSRDWGPPEVNAIYELGNAYARAERFADADKTYSAALRANAGYDEIYYNIGAIKSSRLGQAQAAMDYYRTSWWINPLSPEIYNSLGNLYLQNPAKYGPQGIDLLNRAVHFFPENPNHWNNLGYLYSLARRYDDAANAYTQALTINPDLTLSERNLASLAMQMHRPQPRILAELADLRALDARAAKRDLSDSTLELARRVEAALPEVPKARFLLGSLLLVHGRPAEAVNHLEWVAAHQPGQAVAFINLGQAYMALGRREDAQAQFRAALAVDGGNAQARQLLDAASRH